MKKRFHLQLQITVLLGLLLAIVIFICQVEQTHINAQTICSVPPTFALSGAPNTARWEDFNKSQWYFTKVILLLTNGKQFR
jgi:hypothetical protein